mmetsp:Transcript_5005/g.20004  ORF Transcript_5005/g.20004 Transcript_5005/m.20004 type:complete len:392 (+) Transcript_5005:560-1735(+)
MPHHTLGAANLCLVRMVPQDLLDRHGLELVIVRSARPMCVDVRDVFRSHVRVVHGDLNRASEALSLRVRGGDVVGIAGGAVPSELAVDLRAARLGVLLRLEDEHTAAFAHDEAGAVFVEGTGSTRGIVVEGGDHGLHGREASKAERSERRLRATGDHDVRLAALEEVQRRAERVGARGTSAHHTEVGSLSTKLDGDDARSGVGDECRDQEGRHALEPRAAAVLLGKADAAVLEELHSPDAAANEHAELLPFQLGHVDLGILHGHLGRCHGEVRITSLPARFLGVHPLLDVELLVVHHAPHLRWELVGPFGQPVQGGLACAQVVEVHVCAHARGAHRPHAGHHNLLLRRRAHANGPAGSQAVGHLRGQQAAENPVEAHVWQGRQTGGAEWCE